MVQFNFFDPSDASALQSLALRLDSEESAYFKDMQIATKEKMDAFKFVRLIHPWEAADMQYYRKNIMPKVCSAVDKIMSQIVGRKVQVSGMLSFARLDRSVESGFPFTLLDFVFLSMPRESESAQMKEKVAIHECVHILQRYFPEEFHTYYLDAGYIQVPCCWTQRIRDVANKKFTTISNPDTFRARLYGIPMSDDHKTFVVTNLAIDPENGYYRELAFVIENGTIRKWGWLHKMMRELRGWPGMPQRSMEVLKLVAEHSMEGHPNEVSARYLETTGLTHGQQPCPGRLQNRDMSCPRGIFSRKH